LLYIKPITTVYEGNTGKYLTPTQYISRACEENIETNQIFQIMT